MPRSKRAKIVSLTKTAKKSLDDKKRLVESIRASIDEYKYVWLFSVGDMRNDSLKEIRKEWKSTGRLIYGKNKVVAKALGDSPETEYKEGLYEVAKRLKGPIGLFLTSYPPAETLDWFASFTRPCYARTNQPASKPYTIPVGPILNFEGETFPHSMEPQLRACGLSSIKLVRGVPSLEEEVVVCKQGEKLSAEKARLLSLLGIMMATFQVHLGSRWSEEEGFVPLKELDVDGIEAEGSDAEMA